VLAIELLHDSQRAHSDPSFPRSEIIQNLSRFAADLQYATPRLAGNLAICQQARNVIRHILDHVLSVNAYGPTIPMKDADVDTEGSSNDLVPIDWLSSDYDSWLDENSDLMKWINNFD
jgi:chromatin structure-remodeling complex subunit RSC3/30